MTARHGVGADPTCPPWCRYPGDTWGAAGDQQLRIHGAPVAHGLGLAVEVHATEYAPDRLGLPDVSVMSPLVVSVSMERYGQDLAELDAAGARLVASWLLEAADRLDAIGSGR